LRDNLSTLIAQGGLMLRPLALRRAWLPAAGLAGILAAAGCHDHSKTPSGPNGGGGLTVNISASATSGRAPIDVSFTSDVHGGSGAYRYLWTFGDGRTSTAANTTVQFPTGGTFEVKLQVTSGDETVTSNPVTLNFESDVRVTCGADPSEAIAPATVNFGVEAHGGRETFTYRWDFGDGTTSTAAFPSHTYATAGAFNTAVVVTSGASSAVCRNVVTIYGVFQVECRATPEGGTKVQFHAIPTFCLFNACSYSWNFGGGGTGVRTDTARPVFTYDGPGTYTATLDTSTAGRGGPSASCKVTVTVP
jgi:PKD repeat protein